MAHLKFNEVWPWILLVFVGVLVGVVFTYFEQRLPVYPGGSHVVIALHGTFYTIVALIGPFQFNPRIRSRWPAVHRWMGRLSFASQLFANACACILFPYEFRHPDVFLGGIANFYF